MLSAPSGVVLLGKVYGLAPMRTTVMLVVLPCSAALAAVSYWELRRGRTALAETVLIGAIGGR